MKLICCICLIIGSVTVQKLCIIKVTATRKSTINQAPYLALNPKRMLSPPRRAIAPDKGTAIEASGTPCPLNTRSSPP